MTVEERMNMERTIVRAAVEGLIAAGYRVGYHDGEEVSVKTQPGNDVDAILAECHSTDEATLLVSNDDLHAAVTLFYGNDGYDVINNFNVELEGALQTATALADAMGDQAQAQLAIRTAVTEFAHVLRDELMLNTRDQSTMPLSEARRFLDKHYPLENGNG